MSRHGDLYDTDLYAWTQEQAARLREGAWEELDREHLIEEIEDVGHSQRDALASHLIILLAHLLKLQIARKRLPYLYDRAQRGWHVTGKEQRLQVKKLLRRNPSLRPTVPEEMEDAYEIARLQAALALGVDETSVPEVCPWTAPQVLDEGFWPEGESTP